MADTVLATSREHGHAYPVLIIWSLRNAEDQLRRSLGLKVTIEDKKGKGKVIIDCAGVEDFDAIVAAQGR